MLLGQTATAAPKGVKKGSDITEEVLDSVEKHEWWKFAVKDDKVQADLEEVKSQYDDAEALIRGKLEDRIEKLERGDELTLGVLTMVKVLVEVKRKLQPGDMLAGRHGHTDDISRILPIEAMPFLRDENHAH